MRKKENVIKMIKENLKVTGYEEVSLGGLDVVQHPEIEEIVDDLLKILAAKKLPFHFLPFLPIPAH